MDIRLTEDLAELPAAEWDALAGANPTLRHAFLHALQASGCAVPATGWRARFLTAWRDGVLVGALPLYLKSHSWGEFVFDWAWAEAYERHGLAYYPKAVAAVPFTPVSGPRLLAADPAVRTALVDAALDLARSDGLSSLHILFPGPDEAQELARRGLLLRQGVQLHWRNPGYRDFEDYLAALRHDKRKKVRQERRRVAEAGIQFDHLEGQDIGPDDWRFFMRCYEATHRRFDSPIALNLDFFLRIGAAMPDNLLLIVARRAGQAIASAFCLRAGDALYGRSWGALEQHPGLHFETCYYQAIDYCIGRGIALFEGGAQGEHKLARGFLPSVTWSAHWLAEPRFADAVAHYLDREAGGIARYVDELNERGPFRT
ncbi:GNAT family N-acetyltransferase [Parasulfuritortus cantonensis]|uniref:GNAT family N-acetyltransferase n=1 Tax=Parasulfuritortus cantonensis TaxID=2528202 RepID=UPI00197EC395|nr:GNAT family N-acetyltransferase [Parasulfuritortus cantonensis]